MAHNWKTQKHENIKQFVSVICVYSFSTGTPVSHTNKTDHHDITEIIGGCWKLSLLCKNARRWKSVPSRTKGELYMCFDPHDYQCFWWVIVYPYHRGFFWSNRAFQYTFISAFSCSFAPINHSLHLVYNIYTKDHSINNTCELTSLVKRLTFLL